jgi:hypothetical protein
MLLLLFLLFLSSYFPSVFRNLVVPTWFLQCHGQTKSFDPIDKLWMPECPGIRSGSNNGTLNAHSGGTLHVRPLSHERNYPCHRTPSTSVLAMIMYDMI